MNNGRVIKKNQFKTSHNSWEAYVKQIMNL